MLSGGSSFRNSVSMVLLLLSVKIVVVVKMVAPPVMLFVIFPNITVI